MSMIFVKLYIYLTIHIYLYNYTYIYIYICIYTYIGLYPLYIYTCIYLFKTIYIYITIDLYYCRLYVFLVCWFRIGQLNYSITYQGHCRLWASHKSLLDSADSTAADLQQVSSSYKAR